ncbi:MAG: hypothetical protein AB7Q16_05900 [Vicinamibacterales bacterium]
MRTRLALLASVVSVLLLAPQPRAAITFFGESAATPTDDSSNTTTSITITPPASMTAGDLAIVLLQRRGSATFSVGVAGGQRWAPLTDNTGTTNVTLGGFWARFDGNWQANPQFDFSAGTLTSAQMFVFRPNSSASMWAPLGAQSNGNAAAAATITITGITLPSSGNNVAFAVWATADDNTWGNLAGTGWSKTGLSAQIRNNGSGSTDMSLTAAYKISTGATGTVSQDQTALGNDACATLIVGFSEVRRRNSAGH